MELTIAVTNKCNLHCDFCINDERMKQEKTMSKDLPELLEDYLEAHGDQYDGFALTGGEPLMDSTKLENILSVLLSHSEDKMITINTNACYLTQEMVRVFNSFDNIHVMVSIDTILESERGIFKLLENDYREGYLTLRNILNLKSKSIVVVLTRSLIKRFDMALQIGLLAKYFDCKIVLALDGRPSALSELTIDDVHLIGTMIYNLSIQGVYHRVMFKQFFTNACHGHDYHTFGWNGLIRESCTHTSEKSCGKYQDLMKPGLYDILSKLINYDKFDYTTTIEDEPNYDPSRGTIGKRYAEHQPKRKQLQYGERINIRQVG